MLSKVIRDGLGRRADRASAWRLRRPVDERERAAGKRGDGDESEAAAHPAMVAPNGAARIHTHGVTP
jgi:hypothetical protein